MTDHFTLRVYPERLREGARKLKSLAEHLETKGGDLSRTPEQIGDDWTGDAATKIKAEMTALGGHVTDFAPKLRTAAGALTSLADDYDEGLEDISNLNTKWEATETAYDSAVTRADNARSENLDAAKGPDNQPVNRAMRDEIDRIRTNAIDGAAETRRTDQRNLNQSYSLTKQWLSYQTRQAGRAIDDSLIIKVTPEQLGEYQSTGVAPLGLDRSALSDLALANQKREEELIEQASAEASEDLATLEELLGDQPGHIEDPAALMALLEEMGGKADDPHYSEALVRALGPEGLNGLYDQIDLSLSSLWGDGSQMPGDWSKSLEAFNDVVASGLAQYDDQELVDFASKLAWDGGSPARFGMILGSEHADSRMQVVGLAWLDKMDDSKYEPGNPTPDVAQRLLQERYDGVEGMAREWASDVDPEEVARFLNTVTPATSDWIAEGLLSDGWTNGQDGPFHEDTWRIKAELWSDIFDVAASEKYPFATQAMIDAVMHLNTPLRDEVLDRMATHVNDPEFISMLASNYSSIETGEVARLINLLGDRVDLEALMTDLIASRQDTSDRGIANEVGYLLGIMDATGQDVNYGPVFFEALEAVLDKGLETIPGAGDVYGVLKTWLEEAGKVEQGYQNLTEGWSKEAEHQFLAWTIYISEHGEPPGFSDWLEENPNRVNASEPNSAIEQYLADLKLSTDPVDQAEYDRILTLMGDIRDARNIGDG